MAYAVAADLLARVGEVLYARLTDRTDGVAGDTAVASAIVTEAEALVNAELARRYATPLDLTASPELAEVLKARTIDLAEYLAWRGSPFVTDIPQRVRLLYDGVQRWLDDIAQGRLLLPSATPLPPTAAIDAGPVYSSAPRAFSADELEAF